MSKTAIQTLSVVCVLAICVLTALSLQQDPQTSGTKKQSTDVVEAAQKPGTVATNRPEQRKTDHDRSALFNASNSEPSSPVFRNQPKAGRVSGFDFYRDPLNADRPFMVFDDIMNKESANKAAVMKAQMVLLESRYNLNPKLDPRVTMSRGKPLADRSHCEVTAGNDVGPDRTVASGRDLS